MNRRRKMFAVLPTLLTLGNLVCGFGCITFAAKLGPDLTDPKQAMLIAASLIYLAMVFDAFDGSVARLTSQTSEFGAILDSLCDMISFGVAPAFLMLQFTRLFDTPHDLWKEPGSQTQRLLWVIAALFAVCAALRLARFNSETDEEDTHSEFSGLPSPAAASVLASFPIAYILLSRPQDQTSREIFDVLGPMLQLFLPLVTLALAGLMVSRIPYPHAVNHLLRGRRGRSHLIQLVFAAAAIYLLHEVAIPVILCSYAFWAPAKLGWQKLYRWRLHKPEEI
ncbi:MAG: phosphatidylcholine/phosphatidylserine synthase [Planctomycetaceae bacterium]|nr:phosphatidylcholine/phosphatidylserine synthase [Planctomycetaceae bacterium]